MKNVIFLFLLFYVSVYAQTAPRLDGSPYPVSTKPDTLYVVTDSRYTESQIVTIETLQGVLAQKKPRIYRNPSSIYSVYLNDFKTNYGVTEIDTLDGKFAGLIAHFKDEIKGYIICNLEDTSVNAAISLCGITQSIAITQDNESLISSLGIPKTADVRGKGNEWFFDNYGSQVNKNAYCFQQEAKDQCLADYSVFGKMITFYHSSWDAATNKIFASFNPNSVLLGWGFDEYQLVAQASSYNSFVHAADFSINLSVFSNFSADAKQKSPYDTVVSKENTHTVCFLVTDGDNITQDVGGLLNGINWYSNKYRGMVKLGWTISPSMVELAPTVLKLIYNAETSKATGRDYFVAGPSGLGYMYPEKYPQLQQYTDLTSKYMEKADLRIVNIIGNNDLDSTIAPFFKEDNIDAVFYYYYSDYAGGKGKMKWVANKPVIYGRYDFPSSSETYSLAAKLNAASTNIYTSDAYSLIPVSFWSNTLEDVYNCTKMLNSNVRVVTPDEFVALINKNIGPRTNLLQFTANNNTTEQKYLVPGDTGTAHNTTKRWANYNDSIIYKFNIDSLISMSNGVKNLFAQFYVGNEYKISVSNGLDSAWSVIGQWSADTTVHVHNLTNLTTVTANLGKYYDMGWHTIYVKLEDGMKSDAYGPSLYTVTITQPATNITAVKDNNENIPSGFKLSQNYPNPFNPSTRISYQIPNAGHVTLKVYDVLGREVSTLINSEQNAGSHEVIFNGTKLSSGIYFFRLQTGNYTATNKMVLMK
jgi:hypothetical protein